MKEKCLKNMKTDSKILIIIAIILMTISFFTVYFSKTPENVAKTDTITISDTVYKDTVLTIFKDKLVPKNVYLTKTDTFYTKEGKDTIFKTEQKHYTDTLCNKNDSIILQSFITGQNVTKDSIKVNWKKQETIVTNTVEITKYIEKKRTFWNRFNVGVQVGYGYGFKSKELEPYVGVGISFSF